MLGTIIGFIISVWVLRWVVLAIIWPVFSGKERVRQLLAPYD